MLDVYACLPFVAILFLSLSSHEHLLFAFLQSDDKVNYH